MADEIVSGCSTVEFRALAVASANSGGELGIADEFFPGSSGDVTLSAPAVEQFET